MVGLQMPCGKLLETGLCTLAIDPGMLSSWYPYTCGIMYFISGAFYGPKTEEEFYEIL